MDQIGVGQAHLDEISHVVRSDAYAVLLMDRAGWHTSADLAMPHNIIPLLLPPRSPELNPQENVWQNLRHTSLSNRVFDDYDDIVDACCQALELPPRQPFAHHLAWHAKMGPFRRSISITAGISYATCVIGTSAKCQAAREKAARDQKADLGATGQPAPVYPVYEVATSLGR